MLSTDYKKKKKNLEFCIFKADGTRYHQDLQVRIKIDPVQSNKDGWDLWWKQVDEEFSNWREYNQCILNK